LARRIIIVALIALAVVALAAKERAMADDRMPESIYRGELVAYPGAWGFHVGKSGVILVSDQELDWLTDPDHVLNLTLTFDKNEASLRQICERAKAAGQRTLIVAFDQFFAQYRPGQNAPRKMMPDMDEYIERIAKVSKFAQQYGLGLELSLLSPLEIGPGYTRATGESGLWLHYRKGLRDPKTGAYSVELWRHKVWTNNKGPVNLTDAGVRVFAFRESRVRGTPYRVVDPKGIVEITGTAKVEELGSDVDGPPMTRIRVHGAGGTSADGLDRVLVVQQYRTPEMDYFSDKALPFLTGLLDRYAKAGVKLNALYGDEMHIQGDWSYFGHHDDGEFAVRYVSPGLSRRYAKLYGPEFADLAKYMVYFCYGQEGFARDLSAKDGAMHVFGASPEDIRRTALFRSRYYRLLSNDVVDLFVKAKRHAETLMKQRLESRAHATWAESPTIDYWRTGQDPMFRSSYEYTSNFVWSDTVHQAASACDDYFAWGDYLTGNGNDHAEGGWADRDYYALALAASTGILNEVPNSYAAHWGMPGDIARRRQSLVNAYGDAASPLFGMVQDMEHRDVQVLMLYPLDLTAVEERFGSWMTQYGYANMITQAKLLERGKVANGAIEIAGRRFTTLATVFEPFPSKKTLAMMKELAESGGRVIWSGPPPVLTAEGESALPAWQDLFGVTYAPDANEGHMAPGGVIRFEHILKNVPPQTILTDFVVDRVYPVTQTRGAGAEIVAKLKDWFVGTLRPLPGGGTATYLGFRPRDDQSASLGQEERTWFETLRALGAYPATGKFADVNDNTEVVSRTTNLLACRFPNGTTTLAPHFRDYPEGWPGGFARKPEDDAAYVKAYPLAPDGIDVSDLRVNGNTVSYRGTQAVAFRLDEQGRLIAFAGCDSDRIRVDGHETVYADQPVAQVAWAPVKADRRVPGGAALQIVCHGAATLHVPAPELTAGTKVFAQGATLGSRGGEVPCKVENGVLTITVTPNLSGAWLLVVPAK
jgi:hypothetical protein